MLNDDGIMFPVIEKNTSDLANASTAEKIQLYSDIGSESKVAAIKAMVRAFWPFSEKLSK